MPDGATNNPISLGNLYPASGRVTTATAGSVQSPSDTADPQGKTVAATNVEQTFAMSLGDKPVWGWIGLVVLLLGGMWLATKFAGSKPAANARLSIYNLIAVTVIAIVGSSIAKVGVTALANRGYKLPFGIGTIILGA